jgi:hypothetical protein
MAFGKRGPLRCLCCVDVCRGGAERTQSLLRGGRLIAMSLSVDGVGVRRPLTTLRRVGLRSFVMALLDLSPFSVTEMNQSLAIGDGAGKRKGERALEYYLLR